MIPAKKSNRILNRWSLLLLAILLASCGTTRSHQTARAERGHLVFVDQSGNSYLLRDQRSLIKYNFRNVPVDRYDFDVSVWETGMSSDLRFYAFNRDFQNFYILDQYLNKVSEISFSEKLNTMVRFPILVQGQMIWLYNPTENRLEQYTPRLELISSSRNLSRDIGRLSVDQLLYHKNQVYLNDFDEGLYIFDYTGRYLRKIPLPRQTKKAQIDASSSYLFVFIDRDWHVVDLHQRMVRPQKVDMPEEFRRDDLIFQNKKIHRWNSGKVEIESVEYPMIQ